LPAAVVAPHPSPRLTGMEGRCFILAFTKTFAMAASTILAITLVPAVRSLFAAASIAKIRTR
jgi:Cu/Ag efflux pump CusA